MNMKPFLTEIFESFFTKRLCDYLKKAFDYFVEYYKEGQVVISDFRSKLCAELSPRLTVRRYEAFSGWYGLRPTHPARAANATDTKTKPMSRGG